MSASEFIELLARFVEIDTVSPMSQAAIEGLTSFFARFALEQGAGDRAFWVRPPRAGSVWVYSHADTKPVGDMRRWKSDPFRLRCEAGRLYGLGVSDAKFQALNALVEFGASPFGVVIDGGEEVGSCDAARWLADRAPSTLIVVDGAASDDVPYAGTMGQLDGTITYDSGLAPVHPARAHRTGALDWIREIAEGACERGIRFNLTGIEAEHHERSLTVERLSLRFDVRYGPGELAAVRQFLDRYEPSLRQDYPPLVGRFVPDHGRIAPFSSALGQALRDVGEVIVVPGALPENGNHQPNEWIFGEQIANHRKRLRAVAASVCGTREARF